MSTSRTGEPGPTTPGAARTIGLGVMALSPIALTASVLTPVVHKYPVWSVVALSVAVWPIGFITRVCAELVNRWVPKAADRIERMLRRYHRIYIESLRGRVKYLEVLGVATQSNFTLKLADVFVDVGLAPRAVAEAPVAPEDRYSLAEAIARSQSRVVAVIGAPGSGKTTLLRQQVSLALADKKGDVPILLEIRQHADQIFAVPKPGLADVAVSVDWLGGRIPGEWLESKLNQRKCLVLLDGLDEVSNEQHRRAVVSWINSQISRYPGNTFVVTSRPYGYDDNPLPNADRVLVHEFSEEQIKQFLYSWYEAVEYRSTGEVSLAVAERAHGKATDLIGRLRLHPALLEHAANPLLLTMIALVHKYRGELPGTRATLYAEMCSVLLHRRRDAKGLTDPTELSGEQKETVAKYLARRMMERGLRDIDADEATTVVAPVLARMSLSIRAVDWLRETVQCGLLIEPAEGMYAFAHLTLQEYLAAAHLRETNDVEAVVAHSTASWWQETMLLWASGADVTPLVQGAMDIGTVESARVAVEWIDIGRELTPETRRRFIGFLRKVDISLYRNFTLKAWLRDVEPLDSHSRVCSKPLSKGHLELLLADEDESSGPDTKPVDEELAIGVTRRVVQLALDSLGSRPVNGYLYRLPTRWELKEDVTSSFGDRAIWVQEGSGPELYCPSHVRNPYVVHTDELVDLLHRDRYFALVDSNLNPGILRKPGHLSFDADPVYPDQVLDYLNDELKALEGMTGSAFLVDHVNTRQNIMTQVVWLRTINELCATAIQGSPQDEHAGRKARLFTLEALEKLDSQDEVPNLGIGLPVDLVLLRVLHALAVHELRRTGAIQPNEILVLARDWVPPVRASGRS